MILPKRFNNTIRADDDNDAVDADDVHDDDATVYVVIPEWFDKILRGVDNDDDAVDAGDVDDDDDTVDVVIPKRYGNI